MTALLYLLLGNNRIEHGIPTTLAKLTNLQYLSLNSNELTSSLPSELGNLTACQTLYLNNNRLTSSIPERWGKLTSLVDLSLSNNALVSSIPTQIELLTGLVLLDLHGNSLSSEIPKSLAKLTNLERLYLQNNRFSSTVPFALKNLTKLIDLWLSDNQLTGSLGSNFSPSATLVSLRLSNNFISGALPPPFSKLTSLKEFDCTNNQFTGSLDVLDSMHSLITLNVSNNRFSQSISSGLGNLSRLACFDASDNGLVGSLPKELGALLRLQTLVISGNRLSGTYPTELCSLSSLSTIDVSKNELSGEPPKCISRENKNLSSISLALNRFSGSLDFLAGALNLVTVDVSGNAFESSIPAAIFKTETLKTFAAASNCLSGQISAAVCRATALETLVLDGLSAGSSCRLPIFPAESVFKFTGTKTLNKIQGSLPACLFTSLPRIKTLHLSGNGLTGNNIWSNIEAWPANLTNLSISHNRLQGSMPVVLQRGLSQFNRFDASFNRFGGELRQVQLTRLGGGSSSSSTEFNFRVNRLSGVLAPSIVAASNIQVLEGNLFACPNGAEQLPANDPYVDHFRCGSDTLNDYMIAFAVLITVLCALQWWLLRMNSRLSLRGLRDWLDPTLDASACAPSSVAALLSSLRTARRFVALFGVLLVVVLLPVYGATSSLQGTHSELYAWALSAVFKSGVGSAAAFLVFWILLLLAVHWHLATQYRGSTQQRSLASTSSSSQKKEPSRLKVSGLGVVLRLLLFVRLVLIFVLDLVLVLLPNVGYVLAVGSQSSSTAIVIVTGLALSVYKMAWGWLGLPLLLSNRLLMFGVREADVQEFELEAWTGGFTLELLLRGINSVVAPTVALLCVDANCFSEALFAPPPVQSSFSFQSLRALINYRTKYFSTNGLVSQTVSLEIEMSESLATHFVTFEPVFQYGYQCSAVLLQAYVPVFLLMALVSCFGEPLMLFAARLVLEKWASSGQGRSRIRWLALKLLPTIAHSAKWKAATADGKETHKQKHQVLSTHSLFMPVSQDLLILLSFGLVAPLLGLVIVISIISRTLRWHRLILDFLVSEEARGCGGVEALAEDCRGMSEHAHPLFSARWFLLFFSAVFLGFFLIDVAGDAVGIKASLWAPLLMQLLPLLLGIWLERRLLLESAAQAASDSGAAAAFASAADPATAAAEFEGSVEMSAVYAGEKENGLNGRNSVAFLTQEARAEDSADSANTTSHVGALSAAVLQDHIPPRALELPRHHHHVLATATEQQSPLHDVAPARLSLTADP